MFQEYASHSFRMGVVAERERGVQNFFYLSRSFGFTEQKKLTLLGLEGAKICWDSAVELCCGSIGEEWSDREPMKGEMK